MRPKKDEKPLPALKACPLCGGTMRFVLLDGRWRVECKNKKCPLHEERFFKTADDAANVWNTRS